MANGPEDRLRELEDRIKAAKRGTGPKKPHQEEHYSQAQHAWRMVIELVAGLGIGFGIGYGLDAVLGTRPIMMVLFILLGFAAGVQTMMRTANEIQEERKAQAAAKSDPPPMGD
ncbi:MAG: AtpZ/AtpI family protein [Rhodobacteraceae bacterium]|nr:AtpZ/AtpI family protein [Paracoccaceae bacterium]